MADLIEADITQGDTGPIWHIGVPLIDVDGNQDGYTTLANYTCTLQITRASDAVVYTREIAAVNAANDRFLAQLTSEETGASYMSVGFNRIVIEVKDNQTPPYVSEVQVNITIGQQRRAP